jgi:hypothetical protein
MYPERVLPSHYKMILAFFKEVGCPNFENPVVQLRAFDEVTTKVEDTDDVDEKWQLSIDDKILLAGLHGIKVQDHKE